MGLPGYEQSVASAQASGATLEQGSSQHKYWKPFNKLQPRHWPWDLWSFLGVWNSRWPQHAHVLSEAVAAGDHTQGLVPQILDTRAAWSCCLICTIGSPSCWALVKTECLTIKAPYGTLRPQGTILTWVLTNATHKTGQAQQSSIIMWKWYTQDPAQPGPQGSSGLRGQVVNLPEGAEHPVEVSQPPGDRCLKRF